jgi:ParB-like chromosome segregation protein Spo0J
MNKPIEPTTVKYEEIDNYEIDEAANDYPMLTEEEHKRLVEDIKLNGQLQPVVIFEKKIMDGRNRVKAVKELQKSLEVIIVTTTYEDALKLAQSNNDKRRHMSKSQFAMKAAFRILASRVNEDGTPKPKTEWLEVQKAQEVVDKIVGSRNVTSAIKIAQDNEVLAKDVFNGDMELVNATRQLEDKEVIADVNLELFRANPTATKSYKEYLAKGAFSKQDLAKRLVELELENEKLKKITK